MPLFCHSDVEALKYIINHVASYSMFCLDGSECCFYIQYFEHDDDGVCVCECLCEWKQLVRGLCTDW